MKSLLYYKKINIFERIFIFLFDRKYKNYKYKIFINDIYDVFIENSLFKHVFTEDFFRGQNYILYVSKIDEGIKQNGGIFYDKRIIFKSKNDIQKIENWIYSLITFKKLEEL